MHVKLVYAMSVAAPVAMLGGGSKKSDGRAVVAYAVPAANDVRVAITGHARRAVCRIAQSDSDTDNGAGLASDAFNAQRPKHGMHSARCAARGSATGTAIAAARAGNREATTAARGTPPARALCGEIRGKTRGHAGDVQRAPLSFHIDSTWQRVGTTHRVAAGGLLRSMNSGACRTKVGRVLRAAGSGAARAADGALAAQAAPFGIGVQTLGDIGAGVAKVVEPAGDAAQNLIGPDAAFAAARTEKGTDSGQPDAGRVGTLPYDFKEAKYTVLDVVTI
ncbi:branched-chain amino acid ABC transporter [Burkholderia vietnamiensis]|uniref:branched-chain amino acid ABC transporter n=1 Tax=Burkholderia vietnamiensis TaxID=60552 RepID=UPI000D78ABD5|nr:branched-chain amino acid ABC transporter [Burkholderia vietnamiensis]